MAKYSISTIPRLTQAPKPSQADSIIYLRAGKLDYGEEIKITDNCLVSGYPPFTIESRVLGSITNPTIRALAFCESSLNPNAHNPNDPNGGSHGLLQFSRDTFQEFCVERYGLIDDLYDPEIQIECAEKMISEKYGERWGCWALIR